MTATPSPSNVMLGRGALYFDRQTAAGLLTGSRHLGNCSEFGLNVTTTTLDMKDFTQTTTANYKSVVVETQVGINIKGFEFEEYNFALVTMGDVSSFTQTTASVTAEVLATSLVTGLKGKFFFTAKKGISAFVLKQGATTFVLGTDYTIESASRGLIRILPTGGVTDGVALTCDYSASAFTAGSTALTTVRGGTVASIEGVLRFVANNTTGDNWDAIIYRANLSPNGDIGLISDAFNEWTLQGKAQSDAAGAYGGSSGSPYYTLTKQ